MLCIVAVAKCLYLSLVVMEATNPIMHDKMVLIEADSIIRRIRKQSTQEKTAGLSPLRIPTIPLKPTRRVCLNKKLNDA